MWPLMERTLEPGLRGEARRTVTPELTAENLGSGDLAVLGTPAVLALIEEAAVAAVHGRLEDGATTVGAWVSLEHRAPSAVGVEVRAVAELTRIEGRTLEFSCEAYEGDKLIAVASHRRVIVDRARFLRSI